MPPSERQQARWEGLVTNGALAAVEATRMTMAAAVEAETRLWTAAELFHPSWWEESVDRTIIPTLERVGAAAMVAAGAEWGLQEVVAGDEWVPMMAGSIEGQRKVLHHYSTTIAARAEVLAARGNAGEWTGEQMADALGVLLEFDALTAAAGPVSDGLATGIGQTETHTLIQACPAFLFAVADVAGTKTWVCTFQRSRLSHIEANGQTVPIGEPFSLVGVDGDVETDYPGQFSLPGSERVACRCYAVMQPNL